MEGACSGIFRTTVGFASLQPPYLASETKKEAGDVLEGSPFPERCVCNPFRGNNCLSVTCFDRPKTMLFTPVICRELE